MQNTNAFISCVGSLSANGFPFLVRDISSSAFQSVPMQYALEKLWPRITYLLGKLVQSKEGECESLLVAFESDITLLCKAVWDYLLLQV